LEDSACEIYGLLGVVLLLDECGADCVRRCRYVHHEGKVEIWFGENWGVVSSCFKVLKFCSQVSSQTNLANFFSSLIIGLVLSANLGRKREMAVNLATSRCTSLTFVGLLISIIAWHFSGFASIPRCVSMKQRNLPLSTPKVHFSRLSLMLYVRRALKTSAKSAECCLGLGDFTMISST